MIYLIDYENMNDLTWICKLDDSDSAIIFYSKNANTMTFDEHLTLQNSKAKIEYKKVSVGNNALDFQLATYLGFLIGQNLNEFCIISKDQGYDSIVEFWKNEKNIKIERRGAIDGEKGKGKEKSDKSGGNADDLKKALRSPALHLNDEEVKEIVRIVNQYKTKQAINLNLQKFFKDNEKVGNIYKIIKPYLKGKK